jgi:hypothetical protein
MRWLVALALLSSCDKGQRDAPPETKPPPEPAPPSWPVSPAPAPPAELDKLDWPSTTADVKSKWPAIASPDGLQVGGMTIRVQPLPVPLYAHLWIDKPGVDIRMLEKVWGRLALDPSNASVWFDTKRHIKARFPAKLGAKAGVELSYYQPLLDRLAAWPDLGAGALLGQPASALDAYAKWITKRDAKHAMLSLPPGEWDAGSIESIAMILNDRIARLYIFVLVSSSIVDETSVRERLRVKWGTPRTEGDETIYEKDGTRVRVSRNKTKSTILELTYEQL